MTAGAWWPEGYGGPPQISFAAEEAEEMGLKLGDRLVVNILGPRHRGRDHELPAGGLFDRRHGLRHVDEPGGAGRRAAYLHRDGLCRAPEAEAPILRDLATAYPNITAIRVRDAIDRVSEALAAIAQATAWAAAATLLTGFVVLIGAAAAGERARVYEAAVLKTLGATRGRILLSFALRSALLGAAAGLVAIVAGALAGWAVMRFVMEARLCVRAVVGAGHRAGRRDRHAAGRAGLCLAAAERTAGTGAAGAGIAGFALDGRRGPV